MASSTAPATYSYPLGASHPFPNSLQQWGEALALAVLYVVLAKVETKSLMKVPQRPINQHKAYHAHVYFNEATVDFATELCHEARDKFGLRVERVHRPRIGPHAEWSCQITFGTESFDEFIPWLDQHRKGLSLLVHALTVDDLVDHTTYAYWLGDAMALDLSMFS